MAIGNNLKSNKDLSEGVFKKPETESQEDVEGNEVDNNQLLCVFDAGSELYAIPMEFVKEVVKMPSTTPVPQMPTYFNSMANVRGEVYGILDLSAFFNNPSDGDSNYLLIINDQNYRVGIVLNQVPNTLKVEINKIEKLSSTTLGSLKGKKYLTGIVNQGKQMIILFDVKGMISSEKFTEVIF